MASAGFDFPTRTLKVSHQKCCPIWASPSTSLGKNHRKRKVRIQPLQPLQPLQPFFLCDEQRSPAVAISKRRAQQQPGLGFRMPLHQTLGGSSWPSKVIHQNLYIYVDIHTFTCFKPLTFIHIGVIDFGWHVGNNI